MWCVIPAAGRGRRLAALTRGQPKPLIEVAGRPLIEGVLDRLGPDVDGVCIVVPPHDDRIPRALGSARGDLAIHYVEQDVQLGVGHAVLQAGSVVI